MREWEIDPTTLDDGPAPVHRGAKDGPRVPHRVDAYRVQEILAAGGFGIVCRAEHVERGVAVALKVLHAELASNAEAVGRFEREVDALRRLRHPNVIQVRDIGRLDDGRPYFTMELLTGESFATYLAGRGRLSVEDALALVTPLCAAVSAAHAAGIIHRDIKPSNIFLASSAPQGAGTTGRRPVLLDFGLAKLLDAEGPGLTTSRHVVGTVTCMAPEQIRGQLVDARTDVYALGMLIYQMLTGERVFASSNPQALLQMHLHAVPRAPSTLAPVAQAFDAPLLRSLSKRADDRQPSADALLAELLAAARGPATASERRVLALYIEAALAEDAADDDLELFDALEEIFPLARDALEPAGFQSVLSTGSSTLLALTLPEDPNREGEVRGAGMKAIAALAPRLRAYLGNPDIQLRLCAHVGTMTRGADGSASGGPLMRVTAWLPNAGGVLASSAALDGLDLGASPAEPPTWFALPPERG